MVGLLVSHINFVTHEGGNSRSLEPEFSAQYSRFLEGEFQ